MTALLSSDCFSSPSQTTQFGWKLKTRISSVSLGLLGILLCNLPAQALRVRVSPEKPQLGDTLSVVIQLDQPDQNNTPTVKMGQQTFQAFKIAPNQYRAFVPSTPLNRAGTWQIQVSGEGQTQNLAVQMRSRQFPTQRIWLPPGKDDIEGTDYEFDLVDAFKKLATPQKFWNGPLLRPNAGPITTLYGVRRYYNGVFADDYYHRGVDYAGNYGSPVVAPADGRIALVGLESKGFRIHGNMVGIDHGQGVLSVMLHLSRVNVKEGDFIRAGQVIGAVGSSGAVTGPHLHWGLYVNGQAVDPVPWRYEGLE